MSAKQKILIVDDRKENLLVLRGVLANLDAEVVEASNGNDALAATLHHDFALALLDVQMPEMDGYELAALLRGAPRTRRLPIVFLTASYGEKEQVFQGYEAGAVDYLVKPYDPQVLLSKARVFLELHHATSALAEQVAALAASEERYRSLVTTVPDIVYRIDQEGRFIFLNDAVRNLGYAPEELIGAHFSKIMLPADVELASRESVLPRYAGAATGAEGAPRLFNERRCGERQTAGLEVRLVPNQRKKSVSGLVLPAGDFITVEVNSSGLYSAPSGKERVVFLGTVGIIRDITERKREAQLLREAKSEAVQANNAKSRFLAAASHDLRQPLSALSIYASVLKNHVAPAGQPMLENLNDCVGSLSELLTDLLDLSKLDAGVVALNRSDFAIADALAPLVSIHAPEAQLKGLRLRWIPSRLMVHSDPVLFGRILGNLINNAIRYTESGGVVVACRRRQGRTWVEVWDSGIGIAEEQIKDIFEEFKQLGDDARNRGSGLGLAIVAKAAALLGLEIQVRSRPGRGSAFAIELPLGQAQAVPAQAPRQIVMRRPLRVALVDDNALVRQALVCALQGAGHHVLAAESGAVLRAELSNLAPDIVVSDYRLAHGETGFDVITEARAAMGENLPAILITGDTDPKLLRSMAARGVILLHKPLDLDMLQATLQNLTCQSAAMVPL